MANNSTTFTKDNQPTRGRGRAFKSRLIEAIRSQSLLEMTGESKDGDVEKAFLAHFAKRALNEDNQESSILLRELLNKTYANLKATLPTIQFDFDHSKPPAQQVGLIMQAASEGKISADIASVFIQAVKNQTDIELATDIKERIDRLEASLNGKP